MANYMGRSVESGTSCFRVYALIMFALLHGALLSISKPLKWFGELRQPGSAVAENGQNVSGGRTFLCWKARSLRACNELPTSIEKNLPLPAFCNDLSESEMSSQLNVVISCGRNH